MQSSNLKWYIVILLLILILGFLIYLSVKNTLNLKTFGGNSSPVQNSIAGDFSLFDSVTADLSGKITKVDGTKIYFENNSGVKGEGTAFEGISISDFNKPNNLPSSDLNAIELNKPASIILDIKNENYVVKSIIFPQS